MYNSTCWKGVRKKVCFSCFGFILIRLQPKKPSKNDICSYAQVLVTITSVIGEGKSSFGQALLRSRKSMQKRSFPFFFPTGTMFSNQSECLSSQMKPTAMSFRTSLLMCSMRSKRNLHCVCLRGFVPGLMFQWCITIEGSSTGISSYDHANTYLNSLRSRA